MKYMGLMTLMSLRNKKKFKQIRNKEKSNKDKLKMIHFIDKEVLDLINGIDDKFMIFYEI